MKALILAALACAPALAADWLPIAGNSTAVWELRAGTVSVQSVRSAQTVVGIVRRVDEAAKTEAQFLAGVPLAHCGATRGDLMLQPLDGSEPAAGVWQRGSNSSGAFVAAALCTEYQRSKA